MTPTPRQTALAKLRLLADNHVQTLDNTVHRWSYREVDALTLALAAGRPLLVRGEPGTGKTQLAYAAAQAMGWQLQAMAVNARTEPQDLIYRFDAVQRLADAQSPSHQLHEQRYWEPGPLWKACAWQHARGYGVWRDEADHPAPAGHVVLIDEVDKADADLPNSLLELLGQRRLQIAALGRAFDLNPDAQPLVIFTTNEERLLPPAFVRRCVVLNQAAGDNYAAWLCQRGDAHFGQDAPQGRPQLPAELMRAAAQRLVLDRQRAHGAGVQKPGLAEFIDLLGALHELAPGDPEQQWALLRKLNAYAFLKAGDVEGVDLLSQRRPFDEAAPRDAQTGAA